MSELQFKDLVSPVAVNQKTALRVTVLGGGKALNQSNALFRI